jgi:hypothetical protein
MTRKFSQIERLNRLLFTEEMLKDSLAKSKEARNLESLQGKLLKQIQEAGKSNDAALIVETEKTILQGDLDRYANSRSMVSSLRTALSELDATQKLLAIVDDKNKYGMIDKAHSLAKNREKGLPLDEARQAFKSHYARLNNMDKSRLSDDEKKIIDARKINMFNADKLYTERQAKTLGVELSQGKKNRLLD